MRSRGPGETPATALPIDGHHLCSSECARMYQGGRLLARFLDFISGVEYMSQPLPDHEDWPR